MKNRPWPLVLLAVGQFLSPVFNMFLNAWLENTTPIAYLIAFVQNRSWASILDFLVLDPLCGLAILYMHLWVYPFFLLLQLWTLGNNIYIWMTQYQGTASSAIIVVICLVNITLVTYYLLPKVRVFFFNQRLRWWEAKPRFKVDLPAVIESDVLCEKCHMSDISEGGVYLDRCPVLKMGETIKVKFHILDVPFENEGRIVHTGKRTEEGGNGYGVQFVELDRGRNEKIERAIGALRLLGKAETRNAEPLYVSFGNWLLRLVRTGKGLVPEVDVPKKKA